MQSRTWLSLGFSLLTSLGLGAGCTFGLDLDGSDDELSTRSAEQVSDAIATARPIGLAISAAMSAAHGLPEGESGQCVEVIAACSEYPCQSEAIVTVGNGCGLSDAAEGTIRVTSNWEDENEAEFSMEFNDVFVDGRGLVVVSARSVRAERRGDHIFAQYDEDLVDLNRGQDEVRSSSWEVDIDTVGTPGDSRDDIYLISGSLDEVVGTRVTAISIADALVVPECSRNPISGQGEVSQVTPTSVDDLEIAFHTACDGRADVLDHTGISSAIDLD